MTEDLMPPEAEALLTPESVTPAVVFMSSDQAPSGQIICAGAGVFAAAQVVESPGKLLGLDAAAEDVAANWEEISDLTEAKPLGMGFEQSAKFFALHNLKR
jgi:hypothetical protein